MEPFGQNKRESVVQPSRVYHLRADTSGDPSIITNALLVLKVCISYGKHDLLLYMSIVPLKRLTNSSSWSTLMKWHTRNFLLYRGKKILKDASAWAGVRGNPSNSAPLAQSAVH